MADGVDDDLLTSNLVEDEEWIGCCRQSSDIRIVSAEADLWMGK